MARGEAGDPAIQPTFNAGWPQLARGKRWESENVRLRPIDYHPFALTRSSGSLPQPQSSSSIQHRIDMIDRYTVGAAVKERKSAHSLVRPYGYYTPERMSEYHVHRTAYVVPVHNQSRQPARRMSKVRATRSISILAFAPGVPFESMPTPRRARLRGHSKSKVSLSDGAGRGKSSRPACHSAQTRDEVSDGSAGSPNFPLSSSLIVLHTPPMKEANFRQRLELPAIIWWRCRSHRRLIFPCGRGEGNTHGDLRSS